MTKEEIVKTEALEAAKITEVTSKNAYAIGSGLSPAISAAFRIMVLVMPTRLSTLTDNMNREYPSGIEKPGGYSLFCVCCAVPLIPRRIHGYFQL